MSFVRPEVRAALWHWREVLLGLAIAALAGFWTYNAFGILLWFCWPSRCFLS